MNTPPYSEEGLAHSSGQEAASIPTAQADPAVLAFQHRIEQIVSENARINIHFEITNADEVAEAIVQLFKEERRGMLTDMEQIGEMADVCVFGITKRVCPYCRCERSA